MYGPGSPPASAHHCLAGGGCLSGRKAQEAKVGGSALTAEGQACLLGLQQSQGLGGVCCILGTISSTHAPFLVRKSHQEGGDLDHTLRGH